MPQPQPKSPSVFPAPIYRDTVLTQIFADAKRYFLDPLIAIEYAHTLMLARQQIMPDTEAAQCIRALDALDLNAIRSAGYEGSFEDLFFFVEQKIASICDPEVAGKMHTARSRNDIDLTMYRIVLRGLLIETLDFILQLRRRLIELAWEYRAALMPAYTHHQPAQPTTLGHYLMAFIEILERDSERLRSAYGRVNRSPMGACAITTTGFPIDRSFTAKLLGFDGLQVNSYGDIAAVDYLSESCSVLAISMVNLGRFAQDLLLWSTAEFNYLRLSDAYVQISSIMPQKRNPAPLEHVRILASRSLAQAQGVLGCLHNTPFGDMNDGEDDLQPLAYTAFEDGGRSLRLLAGVLDEAQFNLQRMAVAAEENFLSVTELADTLVRSTRMSFHSAHKIVSNAVKELDGNYDTSAMALIIERELSAHTHRGGTLTRADILKSLSAANFVAVRRIPGGPASEVLDPEIVRARKQALADWEWLAGTREHITNARVLMRQECNALIQRAKEI
ncbi:MAG: argininosuccinate lyase [Edaphobacter sp.]